MCTGQWFSLVLYEKTNRMIYQLLSSSLGTAYFDLLFPVLQAGSTIVMPVTGNLLLVNDTCNIFFELQGYDDTWFKLKTFYGNTPYLEMRFPGAAHLIRSSEVPGYHFGADRYGDNTRTRLIETHTGGCWFLMNYTPGYVRI